jgi:hypothetical protein
MVLETLVVFNDVTLLIAPVDVINVNRCESIIIIIIIIISGSTVLVRTLAASHGRFRNLF